MHRTPVPPPAPGARPTSVTVSAAGPGRPLEGTGHDLEVVVTGPRHADRLEVVRHPGPRHRAPLEPRVPWTPTADHLLLVLALVVTGLLVAGVGLPAPAAAAVLVVGLSCVGGPLLRLAGTALPDPLARFVLAVAGGAVVVTGLLRLVAAVGWTPPAPATALAGLVLVVVGRFTGPRARGPLAPARLRTLLTLVPLVALPALAWVDVSGSPRHPGWLRVAVLGAGLVLLVRASLPPRRRVRRVRRVGRGRRVRLAATLYALALAVLTPFAAPSPPPWSSALAPLFALTPADTARVVLPAVGAFTVLAAWLAAERLLGPSRAVVAATLVLAVLVTTPPGWGDLAVGAAVLLVVTGRGTRRRRARRALRGRRVLVLLLGAGALLSAPSAAVFAAQVGVVALAGLGPGRARRARRAVLTLPVALGFAVAVAFAAAAGTHPGLDGRPATGAVPALVALAAVGLTAVTVPPSARRPWRDGEFWLLVTSGLLVVLVAAVDDAVAGSGAGSGAAGRWAVPHVLAVLAVPAVLGVRALWSVLAGALGLALDRVPGRWLRSDARATRGHRLSPARTARTALVALALFALVYARRAFG